MYLRTFNAFKATGGGTSIEQVAADASVELIGVGDINNDVNYFPMLRIDPLILKTNPLAAEAQQNFKL